MRKERKGKYGHASRRQSSKPKLRVNWSLINKLTTVVFCLSLLFWGYAELTDPAQFPVQHVSISGEYDRVGRSAIQQTVTPHVQNGFFQVSMSALRSELEQLPWVSKATVKRSWPDSLEVNIMQHKALCRWNDDAIIAADHQLFYPAVATISTQLPRLSGPDGKQWDVFASYQVLNKQLARLKLTVVSLKLDSYYDWHMQLNNGIKINLGRENISKQVNQFVKVYPKVFSRQVERVQYVDLRYQHGMAVKWLGERE